jgi:hypothetical protein
MKSEVVQYAKERYQEEQQRFDHIESKCGRLMTFVTMLITVITGFFAFFEKAIFHPVGLLDWTILVVSILAVFTLIVSWGHALLSLKIGTVNVAPRKQENIDYMLISEPEIMFEYMIKCYLDPIKKLAPKIDEKALCLRHAYDELAIAGFLLSGLLVLSLIRGFVE